VGGGPWRLSPPDDGQRARYCTVVARIGFPLSGFHLERMVSYVIHSSTRPIQIQVDPADTPAEVSVLMLELASDPELAPGMRLLVDARAWNGQWQPRQLDDVLPAFRQLARSKVEAIAIAAEEDVAFGMSRMLAVYLETAGLTAAVFRALPEAERWLDEVGS